MLLWVVQPLIVANYICKAITPPRMNEEGYICICILSINLLHWLLLHMLVPVYPPQWIFGSKSTSNLKAQELSAASTLEVKQRGGIPLSTLWRRRGQRRHC